MLKLSDIINKRGLRNFTEANFDFSFISKVMGFLILKRSIFMGFRVVSFSRRLGDISVTKIDKQFYSLKFPEL